MEKDRNRFNFHNHRRMPSSGPRLYSRSTKALEDAGLVLRGPVATVCDALEGEWRYRMEQWIETRIGGRYSFPVDTEQRWQAGQRIFIALAGTIYRVKLTKPRLWSQRFVYTLEFSSHRLNAITQGQLERMLAPAPVTPLSDLKIVWIAQRTFVIGK